VAGDLLVNQVFSLPTAVILVASLIAAVTDVTRFKVYNLLTLPLILGGLVYHGIEGGELGLLGSLFGLLLGAGILLLFYLLGGMGAGDVKFMAAVGAWLGLPMTLYVFIAAALTAGIYAIVLILVYGHVRETWVNLQIIWQRLVILIRHLGSDDRVEMEVKRSDRRQRVIPFAAMMAVGLIVLLVANWVIQGR
jgi:prepilin peptidase CpaA